MKKQKNKAMQFTLLQQVIQTAMQHKYIILITALASVLFSGLFDGLLSTLEPQYSMLFRTHCSIQHFPAFSM